MVWLSRIGHCRGFGIQSPTDYWLVRYVINEHWPYYQYDALGKDDDWLTRKLGRLYFRLANWRQPSVIQSNGYKAYLEAGCRRASFGDNTDSIELMRISLPSDAVEPIYDKVDDRSVLIVEGIRGEKERWRRIVEDERTVVTFDLYYCGIVLFDKTRFKKHYIINF
ncbi:MAG: hypothetical protein IJJ56_11180 [Prevotella sp.]|nr:hypothetical protein [Prevotella sp.]